MSNALLAAIAGLVASTTNGISGSLPKLKHVPKSQNVWPSPASPSTHPSTSRRSVMNWRTHQVLTVLCGICLLMAVCAAVFVAMVNMTYLPLLGLLAGVVIAMPLALKRTSKH